MASLVYRWFLKVRFSEAHSAKMVGQSTIIANFALSCAVCLSRSSFNSMMRLSTTVALPVVAVTPIIIAVTVVIIILVIFVVEIVSISIPLVIAEVVVAIITIGSFTGISVTNA